jgi:hypothetical protein
MPGSRNQTWRRFSLRTVTGGRIGDTLRPSPVTELT